MRDRDTLLATQSNVETGSTAKTTTINDKLKMQPADIHPTTKTKTKLKTTLNPGTKLDETNDKLKLILLYDWVTDELDKDMLE